MAVSEVHHVVDLKVDATFNIVTDFAGHRVPFTTVRSVPGGFVARTGIGPLAFDDPMTITEWDPPHRVRLEKTGRVLKGWAEIEVVPAGPGSAITWREEIVPVLVPRWVDPVSVRMTESMIRHILRELFADRA